MKTYQSIGIAILLFLGFVTFMSFVSDKQVDLWNCGSYLIRGEGTHFFSKWDLDNNIEVYYFYENLALFTPQKWVKQGVDSVSLDKEICNLWS